MTDAIESRTYEEEIETLADAARKAERWQIELWAEEIGEDYGVAARTVREDLGWY